MSHEGIRIVSAEQAAREAAREPAPLPPEALTPLKIRVKKTEGTGVEITWKDGHHSSWSFPFLRHSCPCATCHESREQTGRPLGVAPPKPATMFPQYEAPPRPLEVIPAGRYAIRFRWSDGHESGIYSWPWLRSLCRCDACLAAEQTREAAAAAPAQTT